MSDRAVVMTSVPLPGTDLPVSPIVLGGNMFGSRLDERASFELLDAFAEAGGTTVDTAAVYADWLPEVERGCSEKTLGRWLRARPSTPMLVATKGGHPDLARPASPRLDGGSLRHDVEQSLDRLGLDVLPVWFTHRDDPSLPASEIIGPVEAMRAEGLLQWYGVSNWATGRIEDVVCLRDLGEAGGFVATQSAFAAARPRPDLMPHDLVAADRPMLALHRSAGLTLFGYSAQAKGWFAGAAGAQPAYDSDANRRVRDVVDHIAAQTGAQPGQVALAALRTVDVSLRLVVGCSSPQRLVETLGAFDLDLTPEQSRRIQVAAGLETRAGTSR